MVELPPVSPMDAYNQTLIGNVHPPAWQNPTPSAVVSFPYPLTTGER